MRDNAKNIKNNNNMFEKITEVSKEVENQTEMEKKTHDS